MFTDLDVSQVDDLLDDLFETVSFDAPVDWRARPELGEEVEEDDEERVLGGKGSGNFGHSGRPGEVGGSAPDGSPEGAGADAVKEDALYDLDSYLVSNGFTRLSFDAAPDIIRERMNLEAPSPMHPAVAAGIEEGLEFLKAEAPIVHDIIKTSVPIIYADYEPEGTTATTASLPNASWLLINSKGQEGTAKSSDYTVGARRVQTRGLTGDEALRETMKAVVAHEAAHVIDNRLDGGLTGAVLGSLLESGMSQRDIPKFLFDNVSPYAFDGGPGEAAAEVFTAALFNYPLPKELHEVRDEIKKLVRQ